MEYRTLGASDLEVSAIGLGTMSWPGCHYGESGQAEVSSDYAVARETVAAAIESGITLFDTAEGYGCGRAERWLGRALKELGARDRAVIVTKTGPLFGAEQAGGRTCNLERDHIFARCDAALERLGVDRIDLLLAHWPDPRTPIAETMNAAAELRAAGKVRCFGVSNFSVELLAAALGCGEVVADELPYSLVDRGIDGAQRPFCASRNVGILSYSTLGKGVLSGKYTADQLPPASDYRHQRFHFAPDRLPRHLAIAQKLREIAPDHGATAAQVALAWAIAQPGITTALPGAKSAQQVRDNAAAGSLKLSGTTLRELDELSASAGLGR